jgi:uncharacterized membrane protein
MFLSLMPFAVIIWFTVMSDCTQWTKAAVGVIAILALATEYFSPIPLAGAIVNGVLGVALVLRMSIESRR